jgi:hypothetical protein
MVKNDKAAASNEAAECTMEVLDNYAPASISIEWGEEKKKDTSTNQLILHIIFIIEDKTKMHIDTSKKTLPDVMRLVDMKRREMVLFKTMKDLRGEWEPEMDPFEEARLEAEKRHADRARKAAGAAKKKAT